MVNMGEVVVLSSLSCSGLTTGKKISPFRTSNPRRKQTTGTKKGFQMTISVTPPPGTTPGVTTIFFPLPLFSSFLPMFKNNYGRGCQWVISRAQMLRFWIWFKIGNHRGEKTIRVRGKVLKYLGFHRLYLDSDYGQRTDRENDVETEHEMERPPVAPSRASRQNQQH